MTSPAVSPARGTSRSSVIRLLLAAAGLVLLSAAPVQADSGADCSGGPVSQTVTGGSPLYVVMQAPTPMRFGATFNGTVRTGTTGYFAPTFPTPIVTVVTPLRLVVTCGGIDGTVASEYSVLVLPRTPPQVGPAAHGASQASAQTRPSIVVRVVLYSIPVIVGAAALVLWLRRST